MVDETFEIWRDVLRQIAIHDPDDRLAMAAEQALQEHSAGTVATVMARSANSIYRPRLVVAYLNLGRAFS